MCSLTSYISVCISEFHRDVVKSWDSGDLSQKTWQALNYTCPGGHWYNTNLVSLVTNSCNHNVYILPQPYYDMPKKVCHNSGWQTLNKNQLYITLDYLNCGKHSLFIWLKENGSSKSGHAQELNQDYVNYTFGSVIFMISCIQWSSEGVINVSVLLWVLYENKRDSVGQKQLDRSFSLYYERKKSLWVVAEIFAISGFH